MKGWKRSDCVCSSLLRGGVFKACASPWKLGAKLVLRCILGHRGRRGCQAGICEVGPAAWAGLLRALHSAASPSSSGLQAQS